MLTSIQYLPQQGAEASMVSPSPSSSCYTAVVEAEPAAVHGQRRQGRDASSNPYSPPSSSSVSSSSSSLLSSPPTHSSLPPSQQHSEHQPQQDRLCSPLQSTTLHGYTLGGSPSSPNDTPTIARQSPAARSHYPNRTMIPTNQTATKKSGRPFSTTKSRQAVGQSKRRNSKHKSVYLDDGRKSALSFMVEHQIDVPLTWIAVVLTSHYLLELPWAAKFLFLQHRDELTGLYHKGWSDLYFISFWIAIFTMLRASTMRFLLKPIAVWRRVHNKHQLTRFQEEGWVCIYYTASWSLGMYVLYNSEVWNNWWFWFKPEKFFDTYPVTELPHRTVWYYYVQFAFWLQQIFVLHVEAPRKDFWALFAHHTVTLLLISGSIISNFWLAGNAVFVTMDLSDIILAFSKSMKYLKVPDRVCDVCFGVFMVSWMYTRHYLYGYILWSFVTLAYETIPFEFDIWQGKWYCRETAWLPVLGLSLLQILMVYWLAMIMKIVIRILKGHNAEDDRSENEAEDDLAAEDEDDFDEKKALSMTMDQKEKNATTIVATATTTTSQRQKEVQEEGRRSSKDLIEKRLSQVLDSLPVSSAIDSVKAQ